MTNCLGFNGLIRPSSYDKRQETRIDVLPSAVGEVDFRAVDQRERRERGERERERERGARDRKIAREIGPLPPPPPSPREKVQRYKWKLFRHNLPHTNTQQTGSNKVAKLCEDKSYTACYCSC